MGRSLGFNLAGVFGAMFAVVVVTAVAAVGVSAAARSEAVGCAAAVILGTAIASLLAHRISLGIRQVHLTLSSMADNCASGLEAGLAAMAANDLTVPVEPSTSPIENCGADEIGQMGAAANSLLARLNGTIRSYEQARANLSGCASRGPRRRAIRVADLDRGHLGRHTVRPRVRTNSQHHRPGGVRRGQPGARCR